MQAGNSVNSFPGWGGATTTNPRLARVTVKKSDCSGNPHEPWEKSTIGQCRRSTAASRKTPPPAVPVPGLAGYQMIVASGRGWPVVLDVRVHVMVVAPTVNGPGQHRGQHAVVVDHRARPGEELLDRCEHRLHVPGIEEGVVSRQLHQLGTSDALGKIATA